MNLTGHNNAALGYRALNSNTHGFFNIAVGSEALYSNLTGHDNIAHGYQALYSNSTADHNIAIGSQSMYSNTTGFSNVAAGKMALHANETGESNTAIGHSALLHNTSGDFNTAIGFDAGPIPGNDNLTNFTAIGFEAGKIVTQQQSNRVLIGNTAVQWIGGQTVWGTYSDRRIKDNIKSNVPGLSFINKLNPVTYHLNIRKQAELAGFHDTIQWEGKYDIEQILQSGFVAQEVAAAAAECGYDFSGVDVPLSESGLYSLRYAAFVVPLTKAVQELSAQNAELRSEIEDLRRILEGLTSQSDLSEPD
jgi:hypothetical protein